MSCLFQCKQKIHVKAWVPRACLGQDKDGNQCGPEKSQVSLEKNYVDVPGRSWEHEVRLRPQCSLLTGSMLSSNLPSTLLILLGVYFPKSGSALIQIHISLPILTVVED